MKRYPHAVFWAIPILFSVVDLLGLEYLCRVAATTLLQS